MNLLDVNGLVLDLDDPADLRAAAALGAACDHNIEAAEDFLDRCETVYVWPGMAVERDHELVCGRCKSCGSDIAAELPDDEPLVVRLRTAPGRWTVDVDEHRLAELLG